MNKRDLFIGYHYPHANTGGIPLIEVPGARSPLLALSQLCEVADIIRRSRAGIVWAREPQALASAISDLHRFHTTGPRGKFHEAELERVSTDKAVAHLATLPDRAAG